MIGTRLYKCVCVCVYVNVWWWCVCMLGCFSPASEWWFLLSRLDQTKDKLELEKQKAEAISTESKSDLEQLKAKYK